MYVDLAFDFGPKGFKVGQNYKHMSGFVGGGMNQFLKISKNENATCDKIDVRFFVILKIKSFRKNRSLYKLDNKIKRCPRALRFENGVRAR